MSENTNNINTEGKPLEVDAAPTQNVENKDKEENVNKTNTVDPPNPDMLSQKVSGNTKFDIKDDSNKKDEIKVDMNSSHKKNMQIDFKDSQSFSKTTPNYYITTPKKIDPDESVINIDIANQLSERRTSKKFTKEEQLEIVKHIGYIDAYLNAYNTAYDYNQTPTYNYIYFHYAHLTPFSPERDVPYLLYKLVQVLPKPISILEENEERAD